MHDSLISTHIKLLYICFLQTNDLNRMSIFDQIELHDVQIDAARLLLAVTIDGRRLECVCRAQLCKLLSCGKAAVECLEQRERVEAVRRKNCQIVK